VNEIYSKIYFKHHILTKKKHPHIHIHKQLSVGERDYFQNNGCYAMAKGRRTKPNEMQIM
jgi:hypothetical protein